MRQPPQVEPLRLASGSTLIVVPDPTVPATAIAVSFRIGWAEQRRQVGIASLLARMLGSDSVVRTPELLQRDVEGFGALGIQYDGSALTTWTVCAPTEAALVESAQTLLLNVVAQPRFSDQIFERARQEQRRALLLAEEGLLTQLIFSLRARAYGTEVSPFGDEASLARLTTGQVESFYRHFCSPERATIAVVGKTDVATARRWVETSLNAGDWERRAAGTKEVLSSPDPIPAGLRDRSLPRTLPGTAAVGLGYLFSGLADAGVRADWPALLVVDALLGQGKACRLFKVRDELALGYEVRTQVVPGRDGVLWAVYLLGHENPEAMKTALLQTLGQVAQGTKPFTDPELARAKTLLIHQHHQQRQLVLSRARALAWSESIGLGASFELEFEKRIESVKRSEIERVARTLLSGNPAVVRTR